MIAGYAALAIAIGLIAGVATGGRLRHLARKRFRLLPSVAAAAVIQVVVEFDGVPAPLPLLVVSYVLLVVFCAANLVHTGMGIVLVGIALNGIVITANGGMPVRQSAVREAGLTTGETAIAIDEVKRHVERPSDRLLPLADIIPIEFFREVVSLGDLVLAVGYADLVANLLRPPSRHRQRRSTIGCR